MRLEIDKILALCGILFGTPFLFLAYLKGLPLGLAITIVISSLGYLLLFRRRFFDKNQIEAFVFHSAPSFSLALNLLFIIFFSLSVIILIDSIYVRPIEYFIFMVVLFAIVALEIVLSDPQKKCYVLTSALSKIVLLSFNLQLGRFFLFPTLVGVDPYFHSYFTQLILENYSIPLGTSYTSFPGFHIDAIFLNIIAALPSPRISLYLAAGLLSIISLLIVFKFARSFLSLQGSLLATLLASFTTHLLQLRFEMGSQLLGFSLFAYAFYLLIRSVEPGKSTRRHTIMICLIIASLIITHTLSSFISLVVFVTITFVSSSTGRGKHNAFKVTLFFLAFLLAYWIIASGFLDFGASLLIETIIKASILAFPLHFLSWWESDLSWLGTYIIYGFAIIGCLQYLSPKGRTTSKLALTFSIVALVTISYVFLVFLSSWAIVPDRWFPFALILATVPASHSIMCLAKYKSKCILLILVVLLSLFSFCSIISPFANDDLPLLTKNVMRTSFTLSEVKAAVRLNYIYDGFVTTDMHYGGCIFNYTLRRCTSKIGEEKLKLITVGMLEGEEPINGLVVIRTSAINNPVRFLTGNVYAEGAYSPYYYILDTYNSAFMERIENRGNIVYDCQSVIAVLVSP